MTDLPPDVREVSPGVFVGWQPLLYGRGRISVRRGEWWGGYDDEF